MVDWDNDGDLDLLVGGFDGTMFVRLNKAANGRPEFEAANIVVQANGEELKVAGAKGGHAAPAVVDWDGDGLWDLLSGSDTGAVYLFRNGGQAGAPKFEAARELIPKHEGNGYAELLEVGAEPPPGIRTQIAAADYNDDGRVDLLVGDFCTNLSPRPDLTSAERQEMLKIRKTMDEAVAGIGKAMDKLRDDFKNKFPDDAAYSKEADAQWQKDYQALREGKQFKEWESNTKALNAAIGKYLVKPKNGRSHSENETSHGYVWLYLRK